MTLWDGLGQGATVTQLAGIDAAGLIAMIVEAAQTVQRNKVKCRQLVNHVMIISGLLQLLPQSEIMKCLEMRRPIDGLEETLRQAYMLVTSCQSSNVMYRFIMAGNQAQQFRDIRDRIDSFLRIYPIISHIDTRYFIRGLYSRTHPSGAEPEALEEMRESFTSHLDPDSWFKGTASDDNGIESVEARELTVPLAVQVQQHDGHGNAELSPKRWNRFWWLFQRAQMETSTTHSIHRLDGHVGTVFKFSMLAASTNNFSSLNKIGGGSFGTVFKGVLPNGVDVAIKISRTNDKRHLVEFENEIQTIPRLQHANIIKLLGYCIKGDRRILVYEYMPNGSVWDRIHELKDDTLSWPMRFRIIEGIVQGAVYLHQHSRPRVIHRDLKASNIVLDRDMNPRITDFGLAVVLNSDEDEKDMPVAGTLGYIEPEYSHTGVSIKSDVYAFGVLLLEIISAQRSCREINNEFILLATHAWELWSSGRVMELIDSTLRDEPGLDEILRCIQIALLCLQGRADRPTMWEVLMMLKSDSTTLPLPTRPSGCRIQGADTIETEGNTSSTSAEPTMVEEAGGEGGGRGESTHAQDREARTSSEITESEE